MLKKLTIGALVLGFSASAIFNNAFSTETHAAGEEVNKPKNVIMMIGDGMGPTQVTAARLYAQKYYNQQKLNLDNYLIGLASTYADRGMNEGKIESGIVTDSASAGTAFATGHKTYNAAISVSNEDISRPYASFIEAAEAKEMVTGLVTTARITHATPAVFASHVRNRDNEAAIASQYFESGVDVLMGGGKGFFVTKEEKGRRTDKNIIGDFQNAGYKLVENKDQLNTLTAADSKVLGLFGTNINSHVDYVIDRNESIPSLADMTQKALDILSQSKNGFAMMVEGGRIDHAGHANDIHSNVEETLDFDAAIKTVIDFAMKDGNTTVIISADHETGGLSLSRDGIYEVNFDAFGMLNKSSELIGKELKSAETTADARNILAKYSSYQWTEEELQQIMQGDGSSYGREGALNAVVAKHALVGWTGHGHSGVDVGIWGYGPGIEALRGMHDNTELATVAAQIIGVDINAANEKLQSKYLYPLFKIDRAGKVLFPAKAMYTEYGMNTSWDAATKTATFEKDGLKISATMNQNTITVNGESLALSSPVSEDTGAMYLPLEAYEKAIGKKLSWDSLSERIVME